MATLEQRLVAVLQAIGVDVKGLSTALAGKQDALTSGTTLKTVNGQSLLGSGNISVSGGDTIVQHIHEVALAGETTIFAGQTKQYDITNHNVFSSYTAQVSAGSVGIAGDVVNFTAPGSAQTVTLTITADGHATSFVLSVLASGIHTPAAVSPANGVAGQDSIVTLTASAFEWSGQSAAHLNSDWQLATDSGFADIVQSTSADTTNKTSWSPAGLAANDTYYWRVRYRSTAAAVSAWSTGSSFSTAAVTNGQIGSQGGQGFGVGVYPGALPAGFSAMAGTSDKVSANYGNYQYSDGSIMVFVPRFYYRIGHASSPRYAVYGANAIDIAGAETYATEAAANAAGYAMHRAFKDGGSDKSGFFIDKYLASANGTTSCKSVQDGVPISLTSTTTYTRSNGMVTGEGTCTGVLADAVLLARSRGVGTFNVASVFMYSALAMLSLAHAQASSDTTYCAWYDANSNFPKGCNSGGLADTNDAGVTYTSAGDTGSSAKPKTGSGSPFAKTTHNGQSCGVADLNGVMNQVTLGVTGAGSSATDTTQKTNGDAYVLKASVALSSLTSGWNGTNDAWGGAANLDTKYDLLTGLFPWGTAIGNVYLGNGSSQVFSSEVSGVSWLRTASGIPDTTAGTGATGTNQFGADSCYRHNRANVFVFAAGSWDLAASAGVFQRNWSNYRSVNFHGAGFRAGAYAA